MTGLVSSSIVLLVIVGGIARIGRVTSILAPMMAALYVFSALLILIFNYDQIIPTLELVFKEAFQPSAGVAGTGAGFFVTTMVWGSGADFFPMRPDKAPHRLHIQQPKRPSRFPKG